MAPPRPSTLPLVSLSMVALTSLGVAGGLPTASAAPPEPAAARRFERTLRGAIVNVFPQGNRSVLVINRGANEDAAVGDPVRLDTGPTCRLHEVYAYRSKCVVEVSGDALGKIPPVTITVEVPDPARPAVAATVLERLDEERGVSARIDKGFFHGVRVGDEIIIRGGSCRVWEVVGSSARCTTEAAAITVGDVGTVKGSGLAGRPLAANVILGSAAPRLAEGHTPAPGTEGPAAPMEIARHFGVGLVTSRHCLGIVPGRALFVMRALEDPDPTRPHEDGRTLVRVDLETGLETPELELMPGRPVEASARVEAVRVREKLVACHMGQWESRDPDGPGPWAKVSGERSTLSGGKSLFVWQAGSGCTSDGCCPPLSKGDALWAARSSDSRPVRVAAIPPSAARDPSAEPVYGELHGVYFTPSSARFAVWMGLRWVVFDYP